MYYFGGDEVVYGVWINLSVCKDFVCELGFNILNGKIVDELKDYFV